MLRTISIFLTISLALLSGTPLLSQTLEMESQSAPVSTINFAYTILYVEDVEATLAFYERCFGFSTILLTAEKDYGELNTGQTTLAFGSQALARSNFGDNCEFASLARYPLGLELAFTTDDVSALVSLTLREGATLLSAKEVKPWGQEVAYVRDINGYILELCTAMR